MTIGRLYQIYKTTGCGKEVMNNLMTREEKKILNLVSNNFNNDESELQGISGLYVSYFIAPSILNKTIG